MNITNFYIEVLDAFEKNKVDYMVVGGHAVIYHGYVRATTDMDLWVDTSESNLRKLEKAFIDLGYSQESINAALSYLTNKHMIKIPKGDALIDILDSFMIKDEFVQCYRNHEIAEIEGVHIKVIGFEDLIKCKNRSNRMKDLVDIKTLQDYRNNREKQKLVVKDVLKPKSDKGKKSRKNFGKSL